MKQTRSNNKFVKRTLFNDFAFKRIAQPTRPETNIWIWFGFWQAPRQENRSLPHVNSFLPLSKQTQSFTISHSPFLSL